MDGVKVKVVSGGHRQPTKGSAGVACHVHGTMTSVSSIAGATGGICGATISAALGNAGASSALHSLARNVKSGNLIESDIK